MCLFDYMMLSSAPVFVDTYSANYAPRTALLPGVMDTISPDEHKYFYVFARDTDSTNVSIQIQLMNTIKCSKCILALCVISCFRITVFSIDASCF